LIRQIFLLLSEPPRLSRAHYQEKCGAVHKYVPRQLGVSNSFATVVCTGFHGAAAMPIRFLLEEDHAFSPDDVKILVDAFEGTLRALGLTDPEDPSSIKVAKIIVGLAKDGERDPARLRDLALKFVRPN
jgi:hypothetical protein